MTSTVGQARVPKQIIEDAYFPLAPIEEQARIINKIDTTNRHPYRIPL